MSDVRTSKTPSLHNQSPNRADASPPFPRGINCSIEVRGQFASDLPSLDLDLEIDARLPDGQFMKIVMAKDNACDWLKMKQLYRDGCPPKRGFASLNLEMMLARGWVMEVRLSFSFHFHFLTPRPLRAFSRGGDLLKATGVAAWLTMRCRRFMPSM